MPFSSQLQTKLDAAQKRLDAAKKSYSDNVARYNDWTKSVQGCYKDTLASASDAATWYNPSNKRCKERISGCHPQNCIDTINKLNSDIIPSLRAAYNEQGAAQANYDKVFAEVAAAAAADPQLQLEQAAIEANAGANKLKWIFWIAVVVIVAIAAFVWFKWVKKKI